MEITKSYLGGIFYEQITAGNFSYSSDFKKMCVEAVLSGQESVDEVVARYNIASREVLRSWIMRYNVNRELRELYSKGCPQDR